MKPDPDFAHVMASLAAEHRSFSAPYSVERAVLGEFDAARRGRVWKIAAVGATAALLAVSVFGIRGRPGHQQSESANAVVAVASRAPAPAARHETIEPKLAIRSLRRRPSALRQEEPVPAPEDPFVAIPYTVPFASEERATIVRMTLSPAAIAAVGFPFAADQSGGALQADVLVGEDGRARAFRIVADSTFR